MDQRRLKISFLLDLKFLNSTDLLCSYIKNKRNLTFVNGGQLFLIVLEKLFSLDNQVMIDKTFLEGFLF